jgi:hypothetical protein
MWKEFLKGMINPDSIYQAADDRRFLDKFTKDLEIDKIADAIGSRAGFKPTFKVETERLNRNLNRQPWGYGKSEDTEFVTKVTVPIKQKTGRVMVDEFRETGAFEGGFDGIPVRKAIEKVGTKPSKKQPLTDTVEIIIKEGAGRGAQAEVEFVSRKYTPVDRGGLHRKVFEEIVKSAVISVSSFDRQKVLSEVTKVLKDFNK